MKSFAAILVMGAFLAIAVFGIFAMNHEGGGHDGCIAAEMQGGDCPGETGAFAFLNFHLNAIRGLWTAVVSSASATLALTALMLTLFWAGLRAPADNAGFLRLEFARPHRAHGDPAPRAVGIHRWISLRERRDPALSR